MLNWNDILKFVSDGNPKPERTVEKTDKEWEEMLTAEQYEITRLKGTERPNSSEMCNLFEPGLYGCVCCDTLLFDSSEKFQSGTGWPSFTQPLKENRIAYHDDYSKERHRIEVTCNTCGAHLGHVFPDGPEPSGLRYCINAVAIKKQSANIKTATFGGGCFWCTEAIFQQLKGVIKIENGYSGGETENPTYNAVCGGRTGHAEVIQVTFNADELSYEDLLKVHMRTHNPTTLNMQGPDFGTQYRSIILVRDEEEEKVARKVIEDMQPEFEDKIVTEVKPFEVFYIAEDYHQNYFNQNSSKQYCQAMIKPKVEKFRKLFKERIK